MNSAAKIPTASRRFAAGPAKMTATRFHVFARQYASGASAVADLGQAAFGRALRERRDRRLGQRGAHALERS